VPRAVVLLLALLTAAPALADSADDEIARAHFMTGVTYYDQSRFGPAVKEFLDAYRLSKRTAFLYNIARAYEKLGDSGRASHYYKLYLSVTPKASERDQINAAVKAMQPLVGMLALHTASLGAEILVDEETVGIAPVDDQSLTQGMHTVEIRPPGEPPRKIQVKVLPGTTNRVELDEPEPPVVKNPPIGKSSPIVGTAPPPPSRRWLWPVVGVGAAVVVAAVVTGLVLAFGSTDWSQKGRDSCGMGCVLLTPGN
jgi:hypothetical protein